MPCTHATSFQCLQCPKPHPNCMACRTYCAFCTMMCCSATMTRCLACYELTCPGCDCTCKRRVACLNCNCYRLERGHTEVHDGARQRWVCADCMKTAHDVPGHAVAIGPVLVVVPKKK